MPVDPKRLTYDAERYLERIGNCPTYTDVTNRIDTPHEFKQAFIIWFNELKGLQKENNRISKSQILSIVRDVIEEYFNY